MVAGLVLPGAHAPGAGADELDAVRGQLEVASRDLAEVEREVARAALAVDAADVALREASTALAAVEDELADASAAAEAATERERAAAAELAAATTDLDGLVAAHREGRLALADRAVTAYKRGGDPTTDLAFVGVVRADDWHQVAVTRGVLERLVSEQREAVDADAAATRATATAHAEVSAARRTEVAATREADAERARVAALVEARTAALAEVAAEQVARAAVLEQLAGDAAARAVLVRDLERRAAALERTAAAVLVPVAFLPPDGPPPAWADGLPAAGRGWAAAVDAAAQRHGIDGRLLAALVWTESAFRPGAVSHAGAVGLAQLMPGTARGLGVDPWQPLANLDGGARYLRAQLDAFGRVDLALAAYNAGPGRVRSAGGVPNIVETQLYVVRVLERHERLVGATAAAGA